MTSKSLNHLIILISLMFFVTSTISSEYVPVYLWQTSKLDQSTPALSRVTTDKFEKLLQKRLDKDTIVVTFAEPNLSPEDFNTVTQSGERVFTRLSQLRPSASTAYIPHVQKPIDTVSKLFSDVPTISAADFNVEDLETSAIIVDLNDVQDDEDRNRMLARHDEIIVDIYNELLKKYPKVVALLTGRQASWIAPREVLNRKARDTESGNSTSGWVIKGEHILMYAAEVPTLKVDTTEHKLAATYTTKSSVDGDKVKVELESLDPPQSSITMDFSLKGGYWSFETLEVKYETSTYTFRVPTKLFPPSTFSYQCTNQVFNVNATKTALTFKNLQIQPFREVQTAHRFGDPYFCVGFTSPAIWSGIFVAFILATIMAIGLMMMMDMKTMDRFDDPKGKTIIINATD